jgi:hypothetical protein
MKFFASVLFGATALTAAALTTAPAEARGGVSVQIGPGGISLGVDHYRDYCRDYRYRHRYSQHCNRYKFNDDYYSERGEYYRWRRANRRARYNDYYDNYEYDNFRYDDRRYE